MTFYLHTFLPTQQFSKCVSCEQFNIQYSMHARTLVAITVCAHLLVITPPGGIWLIYEHGIQGSKAPAQGCVCLSISCLPLLLYIYTRSSPWSSLSICCHYMQQFTKLSNAICTATQPAGKQGLQLRRVLPTLGSMRNHSRGQ